jgi:hypothetical protein
MVPIGALFYSSILMFRDGLKRTIIEHPLWLLADSDSPPIFDIYVSDFNAPSKKKCCLYLPKKQDKKGFRICSSPSMMAQRKIIQTDQ